MAALLRLRETFWLVPGLLCVLAAAAAQGLVALDEYLDSDSWDSAGTIVYLVGADGSRDVLAAIAGSMLAVASTTFSITIAVLALTSSSYGPRLVRNFMADRGNQLVLGTYVATYLYALLVLRAIRTLDGGDDEPFVPQLAVNGAVLLAVVSIGVLVWFIHHISESIQVWTLAGRVHSELRSVVEDLYPEQVGDGPNPPDTAALVAAALATGPVMPVRAGRGGYVLSVGADDLLALAGREDVVIELDVRPGSYVTEEGVLARVHGTVADADEVAARIRRCLPLATARSPFQDVEFATQQLVELAVRALSPGTNDPYTAVNALDDLSDGLAALARRRMPSPVRLDDAGEVRVVAPAVVLADLVVMLVDAMRAYALDHPDVVVRTVDVLGRVGAGADAPTRSHLAEQLDLLVAHFERGDPHPHDVSRVRTRALGTLSQLRGPVAV